jgi:hypothetical protein
MLIFFVNFNSTTLLMAELIGTETNPAVLMFNSNLHSPAGVFIANNTTIYWSNFFNNTLFKGTLSQNKILNSQQLIGGIFDHPTGVSVDTTNNKIYWVNRRNGFGAIYVGNLSDAVISNPIQLNLPFSGDFLGLFIDYDKIPQKLYWTSGNPAGIHVGNLSDTSVIQVQSLNLDDLNLDSSDTTISSVFISQTTEKIYWTNYDTNLIRVGNLSDTLVSNMQQITGSTFNGPNGIFIIEGSLTDPLADICDATCQECIELFVQFSDLARRNRPLLNLTNSDDITLLSNALHLTQTYCMKIDWKNSSKVSASARDLVQLLLTSDSELDPIHVQIKQTLLNAKNGRRGGDCCEMPD